MRTRHIDRRQFVAGSMLAVTAGALGAALPGLAAGGPRPAEPWILVCDRRYEAAFRARVWMAPTHYIHGDVTALWSDTLAPLWKERCAVVQGLTAEAALACLEHLARGARHVVVHRESLGNEGAVAWRIAPVRAQRRA